MEARWRRDGTTWRSGLSSLRVGCALVKRIPRNVCNNEDSKQLVRASGSVGANYLEANDNLGDKDFLMHIRISRKEAKESRYWLRLLDLETPAADLEPTRLALVQESEELARIFGAIIKKRS
jgi:four helix bundle protein